MYYMQSTLLDAKDTAINKKSLFSYGDHILVGELDPKQ